MRIISNAVVIDCGTQSLRLMVFDVRGILLKKIKKEYEPYYSEYPGFAEQHPEIYWLSMCDCFRELKKENNDLWKSIEYMTVTTMRDTAVYLDENGKVVRASILWLDQREAKCEESITKINKTKLSIVGMHQAAETARKKSKCNWLRENESENWKRIKKVLLLTGYFNYKLTGKYVDSIAAQIGHIPFDYKKCRWAKDDSSYKWELFGIDKNQLPELVPAGSIIGEIHKECSYKNSIPEGVKIIASGSDKGCETLGVGCYESSQASISFGTTATIQTTTDKYLEPIQFMPSYPAVMNGYFNPEVEIFRGYWMISWFKKEFAQRELMEAYETGISPEELLNNRLNEIPPGSNGLLLQPYWGPGLKNPEAKGSIIGFSDVHTRGHIYRAIIEGINYALLEGAEMIEKKTKVEIESVYVSGGGAQSDAICQITADMFNRKVYRGETYEASGLGGAICCFVGAGVYSSHKEATEKMVRYDEIFEPNQKNAEMYREMFNRIYKKIYPNLKKIYKEIAEITSEL